MRLFAEVVMVLLTLVGVGSILAWVILTIDDKLRRKHV